MAVEEESDLLAQNRALRERLDEAEETLRALRSGEVDAVVAGGPGGDQIYTLRGADAIYRLMVQEMAEGALTVLPDGLILFSNEQFASTLGIPMSSLVGASINTFIAHEDAPVFDELLSGISKLAPYVRLKRWGEAPTEVPARISANRLLLDDAPYICLIVVDLREQEKRSQELAAVANQKTQLLQTLQLQTETLRQSVADKLLLLKEVHHRVKNNLQVICSLLSMQSKLVDHSVARELEETQSRILSMALIHESLYGSEQLTEMDFGLYARSLVADIFQTYAPSYITYGVTADSVMLNIDQAIPCGLILNELVMNAIKYAYPGNSGGEVMISVSSTLCDEVSITVSDKGLGLNDDIDLREPERLGLVIVKILAKQLGGRFVMKHQPGATFNINFLRKATVAAISDPAEGKMTSDPSRLNLLAGSQAPLSI